MKNHQEESKATQTGQECAEVDQRRKVLTRRLVMRGAAAAVPSILTLRSGAALARSSNLISTAADLSEPGGTDGQFFHCLDASSVEQVGVNRYDLGEPPQADVTAISADKAYYDSAEANANQVTPAEMCQNGGTYYVKADGSSIEGKAPATPDFLRQSFIPMQENGAEPVQVAQGGLISATAFTSILSRANINIREI